jgi:hypothetical protein
MKKLNSKFYEKIQIAFEKIESQLCEMGYDVNTIKILELIQWHDVSNKTKRIYPNENYPIEIKEIVDKIIKQIF